MTQRILKDHIAEERIVPDFLETAVDKFIFKVATDRLYGADGIWAIAPQANGPVRLGLSDYLQQRSGDVAFVHPKPLGAKVAAGEPFAEMETIKSTLDLLAPLVGEVAEINAALAETPEIVNQDPYGQGWIAALKSDDWERARAKLLEPEAFLSLIRKQAEEELGG
jgi:glycine cleavage system H protein